MFCTQSPKLEAIGHLLNKVIVIVGHWPFKSHTKLEMANQLRKFSAI